MSKGSIQITASGASGGGLTENETSLNPKGYWITGTTDSNNIVVDPGVKSELTLDGVAVTSNTTTKDCLNVSHADVTITLIGENVLYSKAGTSTDIFDQSNGNAITKDGMDGSLTIQCQNAGKEGHICTKEICGSLTAQGDPSLYHAGGIGNAFRNYNQPDGAGFSNFTIKGGIIKALAGKHSPGIGSSCRSQQNGGYTKNIRISGGLVTAKGNEYCSGIGSGFGNQVDGIYISGGYVEAQGGSNAPGIGASGGSGNQKTENIQISGGDTVVVAVGDEATGMPGIGSAGGNEKVSNVAAVPDFGYQGYIQDGTSLTDYTFVDGTPFKETTAIQVGKFYTKVYFGPFRDTNEIEKDTKEQIGANHVISKTGGEAFTEEQLKGLTRVIGKQENGTDFIKESLTFEVPEQIEAINKAKTEKKLGEYPLTFTTPNGTKTTVKVYLKAEGTDAAAVDPENLEVTIGANNFLKETGGLALSSADVRDLASVQGKDAEGTTYKAEQLVPDEKQLEALNKAKTAGKAGKFLLTFTSPDKKQVVITVSLHGEYDKIIQNPDTGEMIKAKHIISKTKGAAFTETQLKELSRVKAIAGDDSVMDRDLIIFPKPEEIEKLNAVKASGKTGEFPLTFATPDGTEVTVTVYLTEEGLDGAAQGSGKPSCGADSLSHPTGGSVFSETELAELCKAKGKDENGDNAALKIDEVQLKKVNQAKAAGRTGSFDVTFYMEDGTKVKVKVALTGNHTVSFQPDGGEYTPQKQIIEGGKEVKEPEEPNKKGYTFLGWYYTDEDGKEIKWNFETPVHENMTLKAKWKKNAEETTAQTESTTATKDQTDKNDVKQEKKKKKVKKDKTKWNYREVAERRARAKAGETWNTNRESIAETGDESRLPWVLGCMAGAAGIIFYAYRKRRKLR
ncbi:InlB B-repeat-containing protein [Anaerostipes sp.]|uniref:InlB B-repeat-containing protein n=1 Tax=Anaerostipes sp. TaxID=1872530 RepID=UPI0025C2A274|nr:InlB B-repeat-containing protein [Anaerostipes sp.]